LPKYEYCRFQKILGNTDYTSIADTGRFWKILVLLFPVSLYTVRPLITDAQTGQKKHNEYKNTFRNFVANLPVSAILV
jgi:hypothetical protein